MNERINILGLSIHHVNFRKAIKQVMETGLRHTPSYACFVNAHMISEAKKDPLFAKDVNNATFVFADGQPVALSFNLLYGIKQERIAGMDFLPSLISEANEQKATVFLYGSTTLVLNELQNKIHSAYPDVIIGGAISPPFRELTDTETDEYIMTINRSGAHLVFVALGCPRQEKWMARHSLRINAVLLGIGGALPVMAGIQKRAPKWMQKTSLEWLYRLVQEPGRMFRRYLLTNTQYILRLTAECIKKPFK